VTLRIYNTFTHKLEEFTPLRPQTVGIYVCGPTVYDEPHIGHARSTYIFEVLRRYLEYKYQDKYQDKGITVKFVRNVTDVDDKIIQRAQELGQDSKQVAQYYYEVYRQAMGRLGIREPDVEPMATGHIEEMQRIIKELLDRGMAYQANGDVYFSVRKFPAYGKLSNRSPDELVAGARVEPGEYKRDPLDFALWKTAKPGEPSWKSPWGEGRPGWHIECTAMSTKHLGDEFDIHGGGVDLVFPHHENEIAQAQAAGKPFARYWVHNGLLTVNGEKMSKSLGNFITIDKAIEVCEGQADALKIFFLSAHYRSPVDYTAQTLKAATARFHRWLYLFGFVDVESVPVGLEVAPGDIPSLKEEFERAMDDDLNTPGALAVLDKVANLGYHVLEITEQLGLAWTDDHPHMRSLRDQMALVVDTLRQLGGIIGLFGAYQPRQILPDIKQLVQAREEARKKKDFQTADKLRKKVESKGFIIADTAGGPVVLPKQ